MTGTETGRTLTSAGTILLVEDEALLALDEAATLRSHGYDVEIAHDAAKAIEEARNSVIDLILMDIDLGNNETDGTETAKIILEEREIPIVFISSHTEKELFEKTEGISSYGYVQKSGGEAVLMASIHTALRLHAAQNEIRTKNIQLNTLLDNADDLVSRFDRNKRHLYVNRALCAAAGISFEDYIGKKIEELCPYKELIAQWNNALDEVFAAGRAKTIEICFPHGGGEKSYECRIIPELIEDGSVQTVMTVSRDITDRKESYRRIEASAHKFRSLVENTRDWVWEVDAEGRYTYASPNVVDIVGYTPEEIVGSMPFDYMPPKEAEHVGALFCRFKEQGERITDLEHRLIHKGGHELNCIANGTPLIDEKGEVRGYFGTCRDISKEKQIERELRESEERFRKAFDTPHVAIAISRQSDGSYIEVNPGFEKITGYGREELLGHSSRELGFFSPEQRKELTTKILGQGHLINQELTYPTKTGELKTILFSIGPLILHGEDCFLASMVDITETKRMSDKLRESEQQKMLILNSSAELIAYYDPHLRILWTNQKSAASVAKTADELIGKQCYEIWQGREQPCADCPVLRARELKEPQQATMQTPDDRFWQIRGYPVLDESGEVQALVEFGQDITEQKRSEDALYKTLEEKDLLMKEINHRVKNNLLMISSLIHLKETSLEDSVDLSDIEHQIDAIRIVHEELYRSGEFTHINLRTYVDDILNTLFSGFSERRVNIINEVEPLSLPTRSAMPFGLIINELATNAIKYGFSPKEEPLFSVHFHSDRDTGQYRASIHNNGRPFPPEIDLENPDTLGLRLVSTLVLQLRGTIEITKSPSPTFTIMFPIDES